MAGRLLLVLIPLLLVTGCGVPGSADDDCGDAVVEQLGGLFAEWTDAFDLATTTSRIAMGDRVADLQRIRREVQAQEWPECAEAAHGFLVAAMDNSIEGFQLFMSNKPQGEIDKKFEKATRAINNFTEELEAMRS